MHREWLDVIGMLILFFLAMLLLWARTGAAADQIDAATLRIAPGTYALTRSQMMDPAATVVLGVTAVDWDTAGEATIAINGNPVLNVLPVNVSANDNVERLMLFATPRDWWAPIDNVIVFGWPRDVAAGRPPGGSYQIRAVTITYPVATPLPAAPCEWRYAYRPQADALIEGDILWGCYQAGAELRTTHKLHMTARAGWALYGIVRGVFGNRAISPVAAPGGPASAVTRCDRAWLWADDQGAVAPERTRDAILALECAP
jgi:hypothetical protein